MKAIRYACPQSLEEAVSLFAQRGPLARPFAGGTDLIVQMREGKKEPNLVVDLKRIPELNELSFQPQRGLVIGAAVPCSQIYEHEEIAGLYPGLIDAVSLIGGIQIQNRATLGGNLCNASPAADGVPPLIVHRAACRIRGPRGERTLPVEKVCTEPGRTALDADEILVSFHLPAPPERSGARYLRFIPRNEMDIAVAGAASFLELEKDSQTIRGARIALAAVAPTPLLVEEAGGLLIGKRAGEEPFARAAATCREAALPISDMRGAAWQRKHLIEVLVKRTLQGAFQRARGGY